MKIDSTSLGTQSYFLCSFFLCETNLHPPVSTQLKPIISCFGTTVQLDWHNRSPLIHDSKMVKSFIWFPSINDLNRISLIRSKWKILYFCVAAASYIIYSVLQIKNVLCSCGRKWWYWFFFEVRFMVHIRSVCSGVT